MFKNLAAAAMVGLGMTATPVSAARLELGILNCEVDGGSGFVIGSSKGLTCKFRPHDRSFEPDFYTGYVSKLGIDIGSTSQSVLSWAVLAANADDYGSGALAGNYFGASAEATVLTGSGVNVLVGGSRRAFMLQPLSVQVQNGINVAVAVTQLELQKSLK